MPDGITDTRQRLNVGGRINGVLLSVVGTLILVVGGLALRMIQANEGRIEAHGERIIEVEKVVPVVQVQYKDILRRLDSIENKIDKNGR